MGSGSGGAVVGRSLFQKPGHKNPIVYKNEKKTNPLGLILKSRVGKRLAKNLSYGHLAHNALVNHPSYISLPHIREMGGARLKKELVCAGDCVHLS